MSNRHAVVISRFWWERYRTLPRWRWWARRKALCEASLWAIEATQAKSPDHPDNS